MGIDSSEAAALGPTIKTNSSTVQSGSHVFSIRAYADDQSYDSATISTPSISFAKLDAPQGVAATAVGVDGATISWSAATGATSYTVFDGSSQIATGITDNYVSISGISVGTHTYSVRSDFSDQSYDSGQSDSFAITFGALSAPASLTWSRESLNSATLSWSPVDGASYYRISIDGTEIQQNISATSYLASGLSQGSHYFKVKAGK